MQYSKTHKKKGTGEGTCLAHTGMDTADAGTICPPPCDASCCMCQGAADTPDMPPEGLDWALRGLESPPAVVIDWSMRDWPNCSTRG